MNTISSENYSQEKMINTCLSKIQIKEGMVNDLQFEIMLLNSEVLRTIRSLFVPFNPESIEKALRYIQNPKEYKGYKSDYSLLNNFILNDIIGIKSKAKVIKEICILGYTNYGYRLEFEYKNNYFSLDIPIPSNIDEETMPFTDYGKYKLMIKKKSYSWEPILTSYNIHELKEGFKNFKIV